MVEETEGAIVGRSGQADEEGIEVVEHLLPQVVDAAVADGVNVGYDVFEIVTEITQKGAELKAKEWVDHRDRQTRKKRWSETEEDTLYTGKELDRSVVNTSQIRQVIQAMKTAVET